MASVVNMRHRPELRALLDGTEEHGDTVRIDRKSRWGNPFRLGADGTRADVIERYRAWLWQRIESGEIPLADLAALNGKQLACWCHPLPCHGDVLARAASWAETRLEAVSDRPVAAPGAPVPVYAGVGARRTPDAVLSQMRDLAKRLAARGWHLRTGGAQGADDAFAGAVACGQRSVFVPWRGYNGWEETGCRTLSAAEIRAMRPLAAPHHPAWERCSARVRDLHARNVAVVLGIDMREPVQAMLCWTRNGEDTGGTGMAIRLARHHRIPVLNLAALDPREAMRRLDGIAASIVPAAERGQGEREAALPVRPHDRSLDERSGGAARPQPDKSDRDWWRDSGDRLPPAQEVLPTGRRRSMRP